MPPSEGGSIFQCGREITREQLSEILETVGLFPSLSRKELAATICEHLGWVTLTGNNKLDACTKLLEKLEKLEELRLLENGLAMSVKEACRPVPGGVDTAEDLARVRSALDG